jgi:subtilisin family serine protease
LTEQTGSGAGINCSLNDCDHGTHVAGIAAGHEYSGISFSGVAKAAHIIPMQLYSQATGTSKCTDDPLHPDSGPCIVAEDRDIISAMDQVLVLKDSYNIAAVNLSLGSGQYDHICDYDDDTNMAYKIAIDDLRNAGIATVVSSGNEGFTDSVDSPACISSAISVGATTKYDRVPSYSNSASFLSLLAPGGDGSSSIGDIYSSVPLSTGMTFSYEAGTSMATPHVSCLCRAQTAVANRQCGRYFVDIKIIRRSRQ